MNSIERIILIDDDPDTSFYNKLILEQEEVAKEILIFEECEEALEYLENGFEIVDLILLDINMPKLNGWQFLERFEKLKKRIESSIVIIMLSSSVNNDDINKSKKNNLVKGFINKPLNQEKIKEFVKILK